MRTTTTTTFKAAYAATFRRFVNGHADESGLHAAYELGREAVARDLGLLDLALVHHEVLAAVLGDVPDPENARRTARAAADFQVEALSAYEVVRRGVGETLEALALERRQATVLRRLSTLLSDTSLAVYGRSSLQEVFQLVVEQACELTGAAGCVAQAALPGVGRPALAASFEQPDVDVVRLAGDALAAVSGQEDASRATSVETTTTAGEVVAAPLTALDGRPIGVLAVAGRPDSRFGELGAALLVHIAQMAAAALERSARYAS